MVRTVSSITGQQKSARCNCGYRKLWWRSFCPVWWRAKHRVSSFVFSCTQGHSELTNKTKLLRVSNYYFSVVMDTEYSTLIQKGIFSGDQDCSYTNFLVCISQIIKITELLTLLICSHVSSNKQFIQTAPMSTDDLYRKLSCHML